MQRLRELSWTEDQTVAIEFRWADGHNERITEIAAEFVRLKVDVIVTYGNTPALEAKRAVAAIPIVFAAAGDPVGTGLVDSLARPGGNVTGLSIQQTDLAGKRLEILRELLPGLRTLAILANADSPNAVLEMGEAEAAARRFGLNAIRSEVRRADDFAPALDALKDRAQALYVCSDPLITTNRLRLNTLALGARLPTMHGFREFVEAGGLMSYGPTFPTCFDAPVNMSIRFARSKARRSAGRATNQIRTDCQSFDVKGARPRHPRSIPPASERGDRLNGKCPLLALSGHLVAPHMSAIGGKADIAPASQNVR